MKNNHGDIFNKEEILIATEKGFDFYWEDIDDEVERFVTLIAQKGGVTIEELGDLDIISDTRDFVIKAIQKRFGMTFKAK